MPITSLHYERPLTAHASIRMNQRRISAKALELVLAYGRTIYSRGAAFKVIGRREVTSYAARGIDLRAADGLHVLLGHDGAVITTYRNHNLRKIRPSVRRNAYCH